MSGDKLEQIFKMQAELDTFIRQKRKLGFSAEEWVQRKCLALMDETSELLNEVNYKWWKNPKPINQSAVCEELVDMLHFWVSMCIDMGISADDVYEVYRRKNEENRNRQNGTSTKQGYAIKNTD